MLEFLKEYKEVIVSGLAVILTIVAILVKRKPKTTDDFFNCLDEALSYIPYLVICAEGNGSGKEKKAQVISSGLAYVKKFLKRDLSLKETEYATREIGSSIEAILEAPQKKGVSSRC